MINLEDHIIVRKRKKYKFAKFANSPLCFELEEWTKSTVDVVEVGAGTGLFSVELAQRHPDTSFVAIDVKADRLQKGAYEAAARGLTNVRFLRARADQLVECFNQDSTQVVWLTFADPFPRRGSSGRRMSHATYLKQYASLLHEHGSFILKHDNPHFFSWSLEQLVQEKWRIVELSFDLHDSELPEDYKIMTTYEQRWIDEGLNIQLVRATKPSR